MKIKNRTNLISRLHNEYENIAVWADGTWAEVGSGYGGEQDGNNPELTLRRPYFYDQSYRSCRRMVAAMEEAIETEVSLSAIYDRMSSPGNACHRLTGGVAGPS